MMEFIRTPTILLSDVQKQLHPVKLASRLPNGPMTNNSAEVEQHLREISMNLNKSSISPNYYGFVTGGATPAALLADFYVSCFDQNLHSHLPNESIATSVEVAALNMLLDLFYLPREEWGIGNPYYGCGSFTTGATASNVIGLALGREWVLSRAAEREAGERLSVGEHGVHSVMRAGGISNLVILSTLPHSSIGKAASIVGMGRSNVINVGRPDDPLDIDMEKLETEITRPGQATILAISMGEVNTGRFATKSLDQMKSIRALCDQHNVWLHVDGAFGLFGRLLMDDEGRRDFPQIANGCEGLELADSITGDAHKLLNVPYDCGFYFTRHKQLATDVFRNANAAYLMSPATAAGGTDDCDGILSPLNIGIENSRRFRALPVYTTLYAYGRSEYVAMLRRQIGLARRIASWLGKNSEDYELLPRGPGDMETKIDRVFMIVLFRSRHRCHAERLVQRINGSGVMYVSGTRWDGQPAARIAVSNWAVDVERDGELVEGVLDRCRGHDRLCGST